VIKYCQRQHYSLILEYIPRVELAVSHRVPPLVADRGMLNASIGGGYRGNKILGQTKLAAAAP
jgi:hypothetical protein